MAVEVAPSSQVFGVVRPRAVLELPMPERKLSVAGRKRSRDDVMDRYDDSDLSCPSSRTHSPYSRLDDDQMRDSDGPLAEELSARLRGASVSGRPPLESRKSMRLEGPSTDRPLTADSVHSTGSSHSHDPATLALGPSWTSMLPYDPKHAHLQSAIRGWTVFVEAQFPLRNVKFEWLKRSEPTGYLVGAISTDPSSGSKWRGGSPGYFLFDEDLRRCRLIAKSWNNAIDALRSGLFEGDDVLVARDHQNGYAQSLDTSSSHPPQGDLSPETMQLD